MQKRPVSSSSADIAIPLAEERARVTTRSVSRGRVRIAAKTETIKEPIEAELREDAVSVRRVPVGREIKEPPSVRSEGDVTIIPVVKEVLHIERRLVLVEEIHVATTKRQRVVKGSVPLRRQRVEINHLRKEAKAKEE
jgi:stress response protein YsnF